MFVILPIHDSVEVLGERGSLCPGREDPRCKGFCTVDSRTDEIIDPDCFRRSQ